MREILERVFTIAAQAAILILCIFLLRSLAGRSKAAWAFSAAALLMIFVVGIAMFLSAKKEEAAYGEPLLGQQTAGTGTANPTALPTQKPPASPVPLGETIEALDYFSTADTYAPVITAKDDPELWIKNAQRYITLAAEAEALMVLPWFQKYDMDGDGERDDLLSLTSFYNSYGVDALQVCYDFDLYKDEQSQRPVVSAWIRCARANLCVYDVADADGDGAPEIILQTAYVTDVPIEEASARLYAFKVEGNTLVQMPVPDFYYRQYEAEAARINARNALSIEELQRCYSLGRLLCEIDNGSEERYPNEEFERLSGLADAWFGEITDVPSGAAVYCDLWDCYEGWGAEYAAGFPTYVKALYATEIYKRESGLMKLYIEAEIEHPLSASPQRTIASVLLDASNDGGMRYHEQFFADADDDGVTEIYLRFYIPYVSEAESQSQCYCIAIRGDAFAVSELSLGEYAVAQNSQTADAAPESLAP